MFKLGPGKQIMKPKIFCDYLPWGVLPPFLYRGPCQEFVVDPQILSHSFEEQQALSLNSLRP